MNSYASGSGVDLDFTFRDRNNALADPATADLDVEDASGTVTRYALTDATRLSQGVYRLTVVVNNVTGQTERWYYRGKGTGGLLCATPDLAFLVEATRF